MIPIIILLAAFILIAVRQIGNMKLQIWQIMLLGALAIIGTPVVLSLARKANTEPKILLLSLAFAVTIGSVY